MMRQELHTIIEKKDLKIRQIIALLSAKIMIIENFKSIEILKNILDTADQRSVGCLKIQLKNIFQNVAQQQKDRNRKEGRGLKIENRFF